VISTSVFERADGLEDPTEAGPARRGRYRREDIVASTELTDRGASGGR
jgi:hypothetical protein